MILDIGKKILHLVKSFFNTNQQEIFDQGLDGLKKYEENKAYLYYQEVEVAMTKS